MVDRVIQQAAARNGHPYLKDSFPRTALDSVQGKEYTVHLKNAIHRHTRKLVQCRFLSIRVFLRGWCI